MPSNPWCPGPGTSEKHPKREANILLIDRLLDLYSWIIIIRAVLSWFSPDPSHPFVRFMEKITEPVLAPIRKLIPPEKLGGLDISPLIALFLLQLLQHFI